MCIFSFWSRHCHFAGRLIDVESPQVVHAELALVYMAIGCSCSSSLRLTNISWSYYSVLQGVAFTSLAAEGANNEPAKVGTVIATRNLSLFVDGIEDTPVKYVG